MPIVAIRVAGRDYQVACGDGEEDRLRQLADEVDERIISLTYGMKQTPSEPMALLLAALMLSDELSEKQKEIDFLRAQPPALSESQDAARLAQVEQALAATMHDMATRIEKLADSIEIRG
ncbi:MAG: cell division protein ZapA [Alphaproteobacteria bacterium]|nr:cell division protein ZapA [Alphaproteobacteria bacterium]